MSVEAPVKWVVRTAFPLYLLVTTECGKCGKGNEGITNEVDIINFHWAGHGKNTGIHDNLLEFCRPQEKVHIQVKIIELSYEFSIIRAQPWIAARMKRARPYIRPRSVGCT